MPKLAIVGYGKMGRLIDQLAPEFGFEVIARIDVDRPEKLEGADVAVDFSTASAVVDHVTQASGLQVPIVIGATGWQNEIEKVKSLITSHNSAAVWSPNFSIGVNVFTQLVTHAAKLLKDDPTYGAWAWEIHHITKQDAPSGTLLKLTQAMRDAGYTREISSSSNRAGAHPGTHEIGFDSSADTITLRHSARNREGFARGALKAAQWIIGRKGFYEFSEVLFGG